MSWHVSYTRGQIPNREADPLATQPCPLTPLYTHFVAYHALAFIDRYARVMEAAPPSYEKATLVNAWDLVAKYILSSDLCSAASVCQSWHATFVPHLWGNPAAHFGTENDRVYIALTRFKQTLSWARLYVRSFTHTLHLPPAHAEIYDGPHADWLREVLERLPNLQSLIVRGLPFFDHAALVALRYKPCEAQQELDRRTVAHNAVELPADIPTRLPYQRPRAPPNTIPIFGLRLLDASRCTNTTATGLCEALKRLDQLLYLDLSYTYAARDRAVLTVLQSYSGLQVVKLRGINLRDDDVTTLAQAIGTRVRSLDVRNNQLTDRSARLLLDSCFVKQASDSNHYRNGSVTGRSHALLPYLGHDMLAIYQGEEFEAHLRNAFTSTFVSRLAFEDAPEGGITHLYISNNRLSVEGISGLLRSCRLHVLDAKVDNRLAPHQSSVHRDSLSEQALPGAEKLASLFAGPSGENLHYMKISHDLVTKKPPKLDEESAVPGRIELGDTRVPPRADIAELENTPAAPVAPAIHELPAYSEVRAELPGDPIQMVITPATGKPPEETDKDRADFDQARRGSAIAPEPVTGRIESPQNMLHPRSTILAIAPPGSPVPTATLPMRHPASSSSGHDLTSMRPRTYSNVLKRRQARVRHMQQSESFHPGLVPHMSQLTLTDVPVVSADEEIAVRLIAFIRLCAEESYLARQQARTDYTLPPGRRGASSTIRDATKQLFALETIVLQMAPEKSIQQKPAGSKWRHDWTSSMTGDNDSNSFWSAAESDFSFFGEDEEVRFPSLEPPGRSMFTQTRADRQTASNMTFPSGQGPVIAQHQGETTPLVDNLARLSQFRKSKKAVYEARVAQGEIDPEVEGYWPGVIRIIRPSINYNPLTEEDEVTDYYGNAFSKGYLYK